MASMGRHMRAAALIIARDAQARAAVWSEQIPPSIKVVARENTATISSGVGPSYPNEVHPVRHPVFGPTARNPRPGWVTNAYRPFLVPAVKAKGDAATAEIARYIDDVAHENGFR